MLADANKLIVKSNTLEFENKKLKEEMDAKATEVCFS